MKAAHRRPATAAVIVALAGVAACARPDGSGAATAADSLARVELAFAEAARSSNVRDAFLAYIADDATLFRPGPVEGRAALEREQPGPELLAWRPIYAEVARSGDLGFTTGPWTFRPRRDTAEVAFGHFVTVWKKQPDGEWRFVLDIGVSTMPDTAYPREVETGSPDSAAAAGGTAEELLEAEARLGAGAEADGYPAALLAALDERARVLRPGARPALGAHAAGQLVAPGAIAWTPAQAHVSEAGDLGYVWGDYELRPPAGDVERGSFLRIWRRGADGEWRIAIDLLSPVRGPRA